MTPMALEIQEDLFSPDMLAIIHRLLPLADEASLRDDAVEFTLGGGVVACYMIAAGGAMVDTTLPTVSNMVSIEIEGRVLQMLQFFLLAGGRVRERVVLRSPLLLGKTPDEGWTPEEACTPPVWPRNARGATVKPDLLALTRKVFGL